MNGLLSLKHEFEAFAQEVDTNYWRKEPWQKLEIAYNKGVADARAVDAKRALDLLDDPL